MCILLFYGGEHIESREVIFLLRSNKMGGMKDGSMDDVGSSTDTDLPE